jgi:2-amino-4-hydroxy-6-hydroxymethyldihydropteridine diphosphokinase
MDEAYLSLGSNVGDRLASLGRAVDGLRRGGLEIVKCSTVYETEPQDFIDQPPFLNCVVGVRTTLTAMELLNLCLAIEAEIGRKRTIPFGPRPIDVDVLTFSDAEISTAELTIPHPRMGERNFVLTPLAEIDPDFKIRGQPIGQLLAACASQGVVPFCRLWNDGVPGF